MRTKGRQADRPMDLAQPPLSSVKPRGCSLRGLCLSQMSDGDCSHQTSSQQTHIGPNIPWQIFKEFSLLTSAWPFEQVYILKFNFLICLYVNVHDPYCTLIKKSKNYFFFFFPKDLLCYFMSFQIQNIIYLQKCMAYIPITIIIIWTIRLLINYTTLNRITLFFFHHYCFEVLHQSALYVFQSQKMYLWFSCLLQP